MAARVVKMAIIFTAPKRMARTPLAIRPIAEAAFTIATKSKAREGLIPMDVALTPRKVRAKWGDLVIIKVIVRWIVSLG